MNYPINTKIEHTNISLGAHRKEIRELCREAIKYQFRSVVVHPEWCHYAKEVLEGTGIKVVQIFLFPNQPSPNRSPWSDEIDVFVDFRYCDSWRIQFGLKRKLQMIQAVCCDKPTKIVIETNLLTDKEIYIASRMVKKFKFDYIKSSTGLFERVRTHQEELRIIQRALVMPVLTFTLKGVKPFNKIQVNTPSIKLSKLLFKLKELTLHAPYLRLANPKIKISGGIGSKQVATDLVRMGVDLMGTSKSVNIMEGIDEKEKPQQIEVRK
jgi:deoxyribose-phosphate aldolase